MIATPLCDCGGPLAPDHGHRVPGTLGLSTPWARQYLPEDQRAEVIAEIPDGHILGVSAGRRPGAPWRIWLRSPDRTVELWRMELWMSDLQRACLFALRKHAAVPLTVTTDAEGYITSIEEAS